MEAHGVEAGSADSQQQTERLAANRALAQARREAQTNVLTFDWKAKLGELIRTKTFSAELTSACDFLQDQLPTTPDGKTAPVRKPEEVRKLLDAGSRSVLTGACLASLDLRRQAYEYVQYRRVEYCLSENWHGVPGDIGKILGSSPIRINADMWDGATYKNLVRCGGDSERFPQKWFTLTVHGAEQPPQNIRRKQTT